MKNRGINWRWGKYDFSLSAWRTYRGAWDILPKLNLDYSEFRNHGQLSITIGWLKWRIGYNQTYRPRWEAAMKEWEQYGDW